MISNNDFKDLKNLDVKVIHSQVSDLFNVNPFKFWSDFLCSAVIGWSIFCIILVCELGLFYKSVLFFISVLSFYRALCFLHEISHLREKELPFFAIAWSYIIGIPLLTPRFLYLEIHQAHHHKNKYGTKFDGEYVAEFSSSYKQILLVFINNLFAPIFTVFRFAILGPISYCHSGIRQWVKINASSLSLKFPFKREILSDKSNLWIREEIISIIFIWLILIGIIIGFISESILFYYALLIISVSVLNSIRAVGATHRYSSHGNSVSFHRQILDSFNVDSERLDSILLCPVGLRFHALHHLLPGLPYHSLAEAHKRIKNIFPIDSVYHQTNIRSVWHGWSIILSHPKLEVKQKLVMQEKI